MSIFKDCDIRGIYPGEIDQTSAYTAGRALATLHHGARIAVGGDVRLSTPALKAAFIRGLMDSGAQVTDIGTIPTPALYWALKHLEVEGGATVTARATTSGTPVIVVLGLVDGTDDVVESQVLAHLARQLGYRVLIGALIQLSGELQREYGVFFYLG